MHKGTQKLKYNKQTTTPPQLCHKQDISMNFEGLQNVADYRDKQRAYLR